MKRKLFTILLYLTFLSVFGQNGLKDGNFFLLLKDKNTVTVNTLENDQIKELKSFPIIKKSRYTTDQKKRIAIVDTLRNVTITSIDTPEEIKVTIPYDIKPITVLLNDDNLFIGGQSGKEKLLQYHIKSGKWYQLDIPEEVVNTEKAIDDLVVNDSMLIAIDNIVMPKYVLFYHLNPDVKLSYSHFKELQFNGPYESIHKGRIGNKYLGLGSSTFSGEGGLSKHITLYNSLELAQCFSISSAERDGNFHSLNDFLIFGDKLIIASKKKGLGIFKIEDTYFKDYKYNSGSIETRISPSEINYFAFTNKTIKKLTLVPNTEEIIVTLESKKGKLSHKIIKL